MQLSDRADMHDTLCACELLNLSHRMHWQQRIILFYCLVCRPFSVLHVKVLFAGVM